MRQERRYTIRPENLRRKYIDFLDTLWEEDNSWSELVTALCKKFRITADYADAVIDAYLEV